MIDTVTKVEERGPWPEQASTTMFLLILKNVTSERPTALLPTLSWWWRWLRAPMVQEWMSKKKQYVGRNGGSQRWSGKDGVVSAVGDGEE